MAFEPMDLSVVVCEVRICTSTFSTVFECFSILFFRTFLYTSSRVSIDGKTDNIEIFCIVVFVHLFLHRLLCPLHMVDRMMVDHVFNVCISMLFTQYRPLTPLWPQPRWDELLNPPLRISKVHPMAAMIAGCARQSLSQA